MNFLSNLLEDNLYQNLSYIIIFFFIISVLAICFSFYYDFSRNKKNERKLNILERAIKDLIEEFRSNELSLSEQKKILQDYKYTLERLDQEISRLADSSKGESNITNAIRMANEGRSLSEISELTGMTKEEIEPIIKFHGK
ncbi:MAG: hypothetical protein CMP32_02910 [Rickettsiales bacterium]|nr:hypothetical protein [Rickettsiales bacterium]|tara:strand:- start:886 stop:1308 length:423 start_codon:yes stop_codon:yes gene_type:complete